MRLSDDQRDRARGVLVATAAGDALGAGYEFGDPLPDDAPVGMVGGGTFAWAPGEWTDDTSMAVAIAEAAASGDLRTAPVQDRLVARWAGWAATASDVGIQTRRVLALAAAGGGSAAATRAAATSVHESTGRSGGNGSLMRTAPVALACLGDADVLVETATAVSGLTHHDPEAAEACAIWCLAMRTGVLDGVLDVRSAVASLPPARAAVWAERIDAAERSRPSDFTQNGWVVEALQAAWCAISLTASSSAPLPRGLEAAVRGGRDTDTVAAVAGGVLGSVHGLSAVPAEWQQLLHGWPGLRVGGLARLADDLVDRA